MNQKSSYVNFIKKVYSIFENSHNIIAMINVFLYFLTPLYTCSLKLTSSTLFSYSVLYCFVYSVER